jgi:hypothetical protein
LNQYENKKLEELHNLKKKDIWISDLKDKKMFGSRKPPKYFPGNVELKSLENCSTVSPLLGNVLYKKYCPLKGNICLETVGLRGSVGKTRFSKRSHY